MDLFGMPHGSVVWSQRDDVRSELTYTPNWRMGFTGSLRRLAWRNDSQATDNALLESSVNGWWIPRDNLTLYATYLRQNFQLNGVEFNPTLYTTGNETLVYGASYQASPRLLVDLAITGSDSHGATGTDERNLSLGMSYGLTSTAKVSLRASLGDLDTSDEAPLLNYDNRWIELSLSNLIY
jgi:hypothetical protein